MEQKLRGRPTYANVIASVALFVALGGGAYAATQASFTGSGGVINGCVGRDGLLHVVRAGKRCPRGDARLRVNQRGRRGLRGFSGAQGAPGTARAYALVTPTCDTCLPPVNYTPLDSARSKNVSLAPSSFIGTWCFVLANAIDPATANVVASAEGAPTAKFPGGNPGSVTVAQWVVGAPDCAPGQIEIRTLRYTSGSSGLVATPDRDIAFSFVVP